ncbi:MAG TPA: ATP-dependent helicase HrpB [Mycobacteriales bacterium]
MLPPAGTPGTDLPVRAVLPRLGDALRASGAAVLVAPPGTGKTTLVPLALAGLVPGRVVVAEPRRVAARAAARRMAALLGEPVGGTVGYSVRGDTRVGPGTRVEVVTTGVLVQRLQRDAELPGTGALVLDEVHERHLDTDLALAFGADVRAALRPDLLLLATSATAQAERVAAALGDVPVVAATSALHDVEVVWCPPSPPVSPPHGLRVDPRLLDHVAAVVRRALAETAGDVLVFLPGAGEIEAVTRRLGGLGGVAVLPLHGRLAGARQDAVLAAAPGRRVVLATAVAESSLTVPGVRVVVDAGLARVPRTDLARGLGSLVTVRASRAAAVQRAGRAGREAPGRVYRCWSEAEHARLPAHPEPEVATADLTGFALQLACWGTPGGTGLALLDAPPPAALEVAGTTLRGLGAVDDEGRVTARGRALTAVGAHPRLARALLDAAPRVGARRAAEVVAVLSDDTLAGSRDDLGAVWRALRDGRDPAASARWRTETRRLERALRPGPPPPDAAVPDDLAAGLVAGLAFPERLARQRRAGGSTYLMAGGTAAELAPGTALTGQPWLAVAVADRDPGRRDARIRLAAAVDEQTAREAGTGLLTEADEVTWADGDVRARRVERLGALVLAERPLARPDPERVAAAVREGVRREGLDLLRWTPAATALRARLAACRSGLGEPWPDVGDEALLASLDLAGARGRADLRRLDLVAALRRLLPWELAGRLDEVAPELVAVPSGSRVRVDYGDPEGPVLAVRVQEVFGWAAAPRVAGRPLRLHLLSPAGRTVAITSDLGSFWQTGYPGVRADLRGRYPRHPWPADPATAEPTRRAAPRRAGR